jgi:hypothetical protein
MRIRKTRIILSKQDFSGFGYDLRYGLDEGDGTLSVAQPVVLEKVKRGMLVEPMLTLDEDACQMLMNELYIAGIRPSKNLVGQDSPSVVREEVGWLRETVDHLLKKGR